MNKTAEASGNEVFGRPQEQDDKIMHTHLSESSGYEDEDEKQQLSEFLAGFPIQPLYTKPNHEDGFWCFWSQTESSQANSSLNNLRLVPETPDPWMIHEKIKSALAKFSRDPDECFSGLIQFWVPVTRSGRRFLTTFDQPFAVSDLDMDVGQCRICCENYLNDVDMISIVVRQVEHNSLIINGPPDTAFLNHLPQLIFDMRPYSLKNHLNPLLASALEHGLITYLVLPIFDPSTTCCVGVLEYCMLGDKVFAADVYTYSLIGLLKEADLFTFDARECQPCKSIDGFQHASDEIEVALKFVCVSHNLCLAQAWIRYEYKNQVSFSSFMDSNCHDFDFMQNKRGLALKLVDYYDDEEDRYTDWISFCKECDIHPLRMGEGLVGKALQNHEPYLCKDISMVDKCEPSLSHTGGIKGSCFAICLRSTYTQNLDYVLEFFWINGRDIIILLESIMFTLKRTLPSFKVVTGKDIGNELCVKEFKYSYEANKCVVEEIVISQQANKTSPISLHTEVIEPQFGRPMIEATKNLNDMPSFKVVTGEEIGNELQEITYSSEGNKCIMEDLVVSQQANKISNRKHKTSPISLHQEVIEHQFGRTMIQAAKNLNVCLSTLKRKCKDAGINEWQGRKLVKRKVSDSHGDQKDTNGDDIRTIQGPLTVNQDSIPIKTLLIIKAKYGDDLIKFSLPFSTTILQAVEEEISKSFSLNLGTYKLKYYDEDKRPGDNYL